MTQLGQNNQLLDIQFNGQFSAAHSSALATIADKVTWLKIAETNIEESEVDFENFKHLTRLNFYKGSIPPTIFEGIAKLQHLESLNLYGTNANDLMLKNLEEIPTLSKLYLASTEVSNEAIEAFINGRPDIAVVR